jgi:hypothetical protein
VSWKTNDPASTVELLRNAQLSAPALVLAILVNTEDTIATGREPQQHLAYAGAADDEAGDAVT